MPRDTDGDLLPNGWEDVYSPLLDKNDGDTDGDSTSDGFDDDDPTPAGATAGDGFCNFDEYRGFFVLDGASPAYERASALIKHLFIRDPDSVGVGYAWDSGVNIHFIAANMWENHNETGSLWSAQGGDGTASSGVVNFNGIGSPMKGLLLRRNAVTRPHPTIPGSIIIGYCFGGPAPPNSITKIEIYDGYTYLSWLTAHEIGHGMAMTHPPTQNGQPTYENAIMDPNENTYTQYSLRSRGELRLR